MKPAHTSLRRDVGDLVFLVHLDCLVQESMSRLSGAFDHLARKSCSQVAATSWHKVVWLCHLLLEQCEELCLRFEEQSLESCYGSHRHVGLDGPDPSDELCIINRLSWLPKGISQG